MTYRWIFRFLLVALLAIACHRDVVVLPATPMQTVFAQTPLPVEQLIYNSQMSDGQFGYDVVEATLTTDLRRSECTEPFQAPIGDLYCFKKHRCVMPVKLVIENCNDAVLRVNDLHWSGEHHDGDESAEWSKIPLLKGYFHLQSFSRLIVSVAMVHPSTYHFYARTTRDDTSEPVEHYQQVTRTVSVIGKAIAACTQRCNGKWSRFGMSQSEYCMCRTPDAGKECRDGRECESACLWKEWIANEEEDLCKPGPGVLCMRILPKGTHVGQCAEFYSLFGCRARIPDGAADRDPVFRHDGLSHICVD